MYTNLKADNLHRRIVAGIVAAHKKLIEDYKKSHDNLVISRNGEIEYINPHDLPTPCTYNNPDTPHYDVFP